MNLSSRAKVIQTLEQILQGQSLANLLEPLLASTPSQDKGFVHELLLGTLRQWYALQRISESLVDREITDVTIQSSLNVGLYQLLYMDMPDYASISETVEAVKQLDKGYGAGLVNAILRKVQKNHLKYQKKVEKNHSLANWLAKQLKQDWTEYYTELGQMLRKPAPIFLRVNHKFCNVEEYSTLLQQQQILHDIVPLGIDDAKTIRLLNHVKIQDLPNFTEGWCSVQDSHAQLSAHILQQVIKNTGEQIILDACSAPGGKTAHILEMFHVKHLIALDNDARRLQRVQDNLQRLQLLTDNVSIICADATTYQASTPFDVILLDAPCTATGVIRRHPDISLLRQANDVKQTVELQAKILSNLWQQLAPNGYLLYVTCSLLKAENEQQIYQFLKNTPEAITIDFQLNCPYQIQRDIGWQCLPLAEQAGDGFYYVLLQKQTA